MSDDAPAGDSTPKSADDLKADIEATRAQLAETADALAAKLDVKAKANKKVHDVGDRAAEKVHEVGDKAAETYASAKQATPEPVQQAIGKVEQAAAPVVAKAGEDKQRTALIAGGAVVALLVVLRIRKRRAGR